MVLSLAHSQCSVTLAYHIHTTQFIHEAPTWCSSSFLLPMSSDTTFGDQGCSKSLVLYKSLLAKRQHQEHQDLKQQQPKGSTQCKDMQYRLISPGTFPRFCGRESTKRLLIAHLLLHLFSTIFIQNQTLLLEAKGIFSGFMAQNLCKLFLHMSAADIQNTQTFLLIYTLCNTQSQYKVNK